MNILHFRTDPPCRRGTSFQNDHGVVKLADLPPLFELIVMNGLGEPPGPTYFLPNEADLILSLATVEQIWV